MGHVEGLAGAVARHAQFLTVRQFSTIGRKRLSVSVSACNACLAGARDPAHMAQSGGVVTIHG